MTTTTASTEDPTRQNFIPSVLAGLRIENTPGRCDFLVTDPQSLDSPPAPCGNTSVYRYSDKRTKVAREHCHRHRWSIDLAQRAGLQIERVH